MNQTKKLTQGAMMLAISGALILIDRMSAYWFTELIVLVMPIVIIMYGAMHSFKDGALLSVGLLIISFLLGNFRMVYLIYVPVGILTGLSYVWGIGRGLDKRTLLIIAVLTYTAGELIAAFLVYPLMGFPVSQTIAEFSAAYDQAGSLFGMSYSSLFESVGLDFGRVVVILFVISTILMGAMEGVLIHILSVFLLKRFKIRDLGQTNIFDLKPSPLAAYLALIAASLIFVSRFAENETLYYAMVIAAFCGIVVLFYYGYIFVVLYGVIVLRRNIGAFFILLCFLFPPLFYGIQILGFLYGSGPLRRYLEKKVSVSQQ